MRAALSAMVRGAVARRPAPSGGGELDNIVVRQSAPIVTGIGSTTLTLTFPASTIANSTILVGLARYIYSGEASPDGANTVAGASGNSYSLAFQSPLRTEFDGSSRAFLYYSRVSSGGTSITIDTTSLSAAYWSAAAIEVTGLASSSVLDITPVTNQGTGQNPTTGPAGPTVTDKTIAVGVLCAIGAVSNAGIDVPTGYTNVGVQQDSASSIGFSMDYKILSSVGSETVSWGTLEGGNDSYTCGVAFFKAASI